MSRRPTGSEQSDAPTIAFGDDFALPAEDAPTRRASADVPTGDVYSDDAPTHRAVNADVPTPVDVTTEVPTHAGFATQSRTYPNPSPLRPASGTWGHDDNDASTLVVGLVLLCVGACA